MKIALLIVALAAACKPSKPAVEAPAAAAPAPADQNKVEKYVSGLQVDVKRAQEAKEKADAAVKKTDEGEKIAE